MPQAMRRPRSRGRRRPTIRSMKMRLPVTSLSMHLPQDSRTLANACLTLRSKPAGRSRLHAAHPPVGDGEPRPGESVHRLPQELARLDHVEEDGEGAELHGPAPTQREVVADAVRSRSMITRMYLAPLGDLDAEQLLDGRAVAEVVDERRDVVEPVRVGDRVVVQVPASQILLEGPVEDSRSPRRSPSPTVSPSSSAKIRTMPCIAGCGRAPCCREVLAAPRPPLGAPSPRRTAPAGRPSRPGTPRSYSLGSPVGCRRSAAIDVLHFGSGSGAGAALVGSPCAAGGPRTPRT